MIFSYQRELFVHVNSINISYFIIAAIPDPNRIKAFLENIFINFNQLLKLQYDKSRFYATLS